MHRKLKNVVNKNIYNSLPGKKEETKANKL